VAVPFKRLFRAGMSMASEVLYRAPSYATLAVLAHPRRQAVRGA